MCQKWKETILPSPDDPRLLARWYTVELGERGLIRGRGGVLGQIDWQIARISSLGLAYRWIMAVSGV